MLIWFELHRTYQDTASYVAAMFGDVAPASWYPSDLSGPRLSQVDAASPGRIEQTTAVIQLAQRADR